MAKLDELKRFYEALQTVPKLVSDMALSIAEAQRRLDVNYVEDLTHFLRLMSQYYQNNAQPPETLLTLFRAMHPPRYQFSETVIETRADLQMTTLSQASVGGTLGFNAPFAVAVNASYLKRSGLDFRATALIRTVLHAVAADPGVGEALLAAARTAPAATALPDGSRYKALEEVLGQLKEAAPAVPAAAAAKPEEQPAKPPEGGGE